ncbi:MAG: hypothetical protein ACRDWI_08490 [Jiangellaceae bacterium]
MPIAVRASEMLGTHMELAPIKPFRQLTGSLFEADEVTFDGCSEPDRATFDAVLAAADRTSIVGSGLTAGTAERVATPFGHSRPTSVSD